MTIEFYFLTFIYSEEASLLQERPDHIHTLSLHHSLLLVKLIVWSNDGGNGKEMA